MVVTVIIAFKYDFVFRQSVIFVSFLDKKNKMYKKSLEKCESKLLSLYYNSTILILNLNHDKMVKKEIGRKTTWQLSSQKKTLRNFLQLSNKM